MKIIPYYAWTRSVISFEDSNKRFSKKPWAQGVILLACVVLAMLLANLPFTKEAYHNILETDLGISVVSPNGGVFTFPM
jgi:NhaA family Na+:H+ antiporter